MKTEREIRRKIAAILSDNEHILTGSLATAHVNAPRALMQVAAESHLGALYWALGEKYKSRLRGVDK